MSHPQVNTVNKKRSIIVLFFLWLAWGVFWLWRAGLVSPEQIGQGFLVLVGLFLVVGIIILDKKLEFSGKRVLSKVKIESLPEEIISEEFETSLPSEISSWSTEEIEGYLEGKIKDNDLRCTMALKIKDLAKGKKQGRPVTKVTWREEPLKIDIPLPSEASSWEVGEIEQFLEGKVEDEKIRHKLALKLKAFYEKSRS